jgi:hypothetical protein
MYGVRSNASERVVERLLPLVLGEIVCDLDAARTPGEFREARRLDDEVAFALSQRTSCDQSLHRLACARVRISTPVAAADGVEHPGLREDRAQPLERVAEFRSSRASRATDDATARSRASLRGAPSAAASSSRGCAAPRRASDLAWERWADRRARSCDRARRSFSLHRRQRTNSASSVNTISSGRQTYVSPSSLAFIAFGQPGQLGAVVVGLLRHDDRRRRRLCPAAASMAARPRGMPSVSPTVS